MSEYIKVPVEDSRSSHLNELASSAQNLDRVATVVLKNELSSDEKNKLELQARDLEQAYQHSKNIAEKIQRIQQLVAERRKANQDKELSSGDQRHQLAADFDRVSQIEYDNTIATLRSALDGLNMLIDASVTFAGEDAENLKKDPQEIVEDPLAEYIHEQALAEDKVRAEIDQATKKK